MDLGSSNKYLEKKGLIFNTNGNDADQKLEALHRKQISLDQIYYQYLAFSSTISSGYHGFSASTACPL